MRNNDSGCGIVLLIALGLVGLFIITTLQENCNPKHCVERKIEGMQNCGPGGKLVVQEGITFCRCPDPQPAPVSSEP